jgi:hypothetical protein
MGPGDEWLTRRELRLQLLDRVEITPEERLSRAEIEELVRRAG